MEKVTKRLTRTRSAETKRWKLRLQVSKKAIAIATFVTVTLNCYAIWYLHGSVLLTEKAPIVSDNPELTYVSSTVSVTEKPVVFMPDLPPERRNCTFGYSTLYKSVYVYEHPDVGPPSMVSPDRTNFEKEWPWVPMAASQKASGTGHFGLNNQLDQYTTEILVHSIITHPDSCLRSDDPQSAKLFLVPFLNSVHFHEGKLFAKNYDTTNYAEAMIDAVSSGDYRKWREVWGLTSEYWERRDGADHITVMAEPLHGFNHPRSRRGSFHYVNSQFQLRPPIVISVELSATFVKQHPSCAAKNIVVPYPITDGTVFNGKKDKFTKEAMAPSPNIKYTTEQNDNHTYYGAPYPSETRLKDGRPVGMYYSARPHGCPELRKAIKQDYLCSESAKFLNTQRKIGIELKSFSVGMRVSTFCVCPGGDSPSAKRMYDAVLAECIPVVLSPDYVWALSTDYDPSMPTVIDPRTFSVRIEDTRAYSRPVYNNACNKTRSDDSLDDILRNLPAHEILRLRQGLQRARSQYSYFRFTDGSDSDSGNTGKKLPDNPLAAGVLPDGGAAHALVAALEVRAYGMLWNACKEENDALSPSWMAREPKIFMC